MKPVHQIIITKKWPFSPEIGTVLKPDSHGYSTYPVVKTWDKKEALKLIWSNNVEGWWHYQDEYVKMEICTAELFKAKLNRSL